MRSRVDFPMPFGPTTPIPRAGPDSEGDSVEQELPTDVLGELLGDEHDRRGYRGGQPSREAFAPGSLLTWPTSWMAPDNRGRV